MYPCSMEKAEVIKLHIIQQNHLDFNDQISEAITKFGPSAGLGGSQVSLHSEEWACMLCSELPVPRAGRQARQGVWARPGRQSCHRAQRTGGAFPCPAARGKHCQGKPRFLQGVERASLPFSIEPNYFFFTQSTSLSFSLIFPLCSHDNLTQSKHKICF